VKRGRTLTVVTAAVVTSLAGLGGVYAAPVAQRIGVPRGVLDEQLVRVALAIDVAETRLSATSEWRLYEADGATIVGVGDAGEPWRFEHDGRLIRAVRPDGMSTEYRAGPLVVRPSAWGGFVVHAGRRYRGELVVRASDAGLTIVNRLPVDEYLKGVVPMEIGTERTMEEFAAAEAQAVAARSYAYIRVGWTSDRRWYDLRPTVVDQAYGGVNAETIVGTRAVESTAGLVLKYDGRVVNAPYHSTCGGTTAEAPEAWPTRGEPYLKRVSDRIPGTDRFYCDISPRFRWTRQVSGDRLDAAMARYLRDYAAVPARGPGHVRGVSVVSRTPSGRVDSVEITTGRGGPYMLRGNDARFVLRAGGGEILNSASFDVESAPTSEGRLTQLTLRGAGYGHGVGMCQWGAIGRARAGEDFRTILGTYFPGTTVEPVM
jgi:stage II sporulation protein D (peptidoglycan lytic transglycosylase)